MARVFELMTEEIHARYVQQGEQGLGLALSESIAAIDRLGNYCFTGDPHVLPRKVFGLTGTLEALSKGGWPYINPDILDMRPEAGRLHLGQWPKMNSGKPLLMHAASLAFHYGEEVASNRHSQLWFSCMGGISIGSLSELNEFLSQLFEDILIPEMRAFTLHQIRRWMTREARAGHLQVTPRMAKTIEEWQQSIAPFKQEHLDRLVSRKLLLYNTAQGKTRPTRSIVRADFSSELYKAIKSKDIRERARYASIHATWPSLLQAAIIHTDATSIDAATWAVGIETAMVRAQIDWLPGQYRQRLTVREVNTLIGKPICIKIKSKSGMKRQAAEDLLYIERRKMLKSQRITFGTSVPFRQLPDIVKAGFDELDNIFRSREQAIREHYALARMTLERRLDDPLTSLLLMLAMTLGSSTETPCVEHTVAIEEQCFAVGKRREPTTFTAALATRMMWFLDRDAFPWSKESSMRCKAMPIAEMTTKLEHRGVNNRVIKALGWITTINKRPTPRNSKSILRDREELVCLYEELRGLMLKPDMYMRRVFGKDEFMWMERCASMIEEW
ncbi:hypothetical protein VHEMI10772 [[Torrubiella] hemipterigena]|uniref:Uncharacterized protein n=1 Tax=[Torrubiella] hemipterigena TaxID=1531966 RepID=A0A0A1TSS8_9HYPO|nr:hypothetical protein VHEMI10772 [[Torrubiella] hemipterigena]